MKRILLFLTVFISTLAFAGERVIINPEQDQDIKVKVNDGGTVKDAVTVTGSTGNVTIGNTAHTGTNELGGAHKIIGVLTPGVVEAGDASGGISIWANAYGSAAFPYRSQTTPGGASLRIIPRTGDTAASFIFQTNLAGASTTTESATIGQATQNGSWTLGPNTSGNTLTLSKTGDTPSMKFEGGATDYSMDILSGSLRFYNDVGAVAGTVTQAGVWSLTAATGQHSIINNTTSTNTLNVQNNATSTGSDPFRAIVVTKGSTTSSTAQKYMLFTYNAGASTSGEITGNGAGQIVISNLSDRRLKKNIEPLPSTLGKFMALKPVSFDYRDGSGHQIGFVAQDVQKVFPDAVSKDPDTGMLSVHGYGKNEARLIKALQEQQEMIKDIYDRLAKTQGSLAQANYRIQELEQAQ
jgi:hypothetical protein